MTKNMKDAGSALLVSAILMCKSVEESTAALVNVLDAQNNPLMYKTLDVKTIMELIRKTLEIMRDIEEGDLS